MAKKFSARIALIKKIAEEIAGRMALLQSGAIIDTDFKNMPWIENEICNGLNEISVASNTTLDENYKEEIEEINAIKF